MLKERASTREQKNVAKRQCCLGSIEDIVLSLSAGGITSIFHDGPDRGLSAPVVSMLV